MDNWFWGKCRDNSVEKGLSFQQIVAGIIGHLYAKQTSNQLLYHTQKLTQNIKMDHRPKT